MLTASEPRSEPVLQSRSEPASRSRSEPARVEASERAIPMASPPTQGKEKALASQHAAADRIGKAGLARKEEPLLLE